MSNLKEVYIFILITSYLAETSHLRKSSLIQESDSVNKLCVKSEQHQHDLSVNASLHNNQSHQDHSIFDENHGHDCNCELQQLDIKPFPYLHQKKDLRDLNCKYELPVSTLNSLSNHDQQYQDDKTVVSTQHQENQSDIAMASSKACNGKYFYLINFFTVKHQQIVFVFLFKNNKYRKG